MTPKTDLQKLFDAALKDTSDIDQKKLKLTPAAPSTQAEVIAITSPLLARPVVAPVVQEPVVEEEVTGEPSTVEVDFDRQLADELGAQLDAKVAKQRRQRRRSSLITLAAVFTLVGGSYAWCVQSPERIEAFHKIIKDIRAATDVKTMVASYQQYLDKIAVRAEQIDESTESMGVSSNQEGMEDVYLDAEMKELMGEDAKTVGARNAAFAEKFNSWKDKAK